MSNKIPENIDEKIAVAVQAEKNFFDHLIKAIVHELRTPLASVNMATHATQNILPKIFDAYKVAVEHKLVEPGLSQAQFAMIESAVAGIKKSVLDSQNFLDGLVNYTENCLMNPKDVKTLSVKACLDKLLQDYPFENEQERALVHVDIKHDFAFRAPEVFINDLLSGLLKNALFYIGQAGKGEITIWTEKEAAWNILHFKDTGLGVRDGYLSHVFDRFFSKREDGTKAGLGFCKEVMRGFGGSVACDSKEGEYTHFILKFPVS